MIKEQYTEEEWEELPLTEKRRLLGTAKHPNKGVGSASPDRRREIALMGVEARRKKRDELKRQQESQQA